MDLLASAENGGESGYRTSGGRGIFSKVFV